MTRSGEKTLALAQAEVCSFSVVLRMLQWSAGFSLGKGVTISITRICYLTRPSKCNKYGSMKTCAEVRSGYAIATTMA